MTNRAANATTIASIPNDRATKYFKGTPTATMTVTATTCGRSAPTPFMNIAKQLAIAATIAHAPSAYTIPGDGTTRLSVQYRINGSLAHANTATDAALYSKVTSAAVASVLRMKA